MVEEVCDEFDWLFMMVGCFGYVFLLIDGNGVVFDWCGIVGDEKDFCGVGFWFGMVWSEVSVGINGIGMVLVD